jgi:hypothetical protein
MAEEKTSKYTDIPVKKDIVQEGENDPKKAEKHVTAVTKANVKKPNLLNRFMVAFVGPDGFKGIGAYVRDDIVVPAVKGMIADAITGAVNGAFYGHNRPRGGGRPYNSYSGYSQYTVGPRETKYNYGGSYGPSKFAPQDDIPAPSRATQRFDSSRYVIPTRDEAAAVMEGMENLLAAYDRVTIADFYDMVGVESEFTDNNFGWTNLTGAGIRAYQGGFLVMLPEARAL